MSLTFALPMTLMWSSFSFEGFSANGFALISAVCFLFCLSLSILASRMVQAKVLQEKDWIDNLPFALMAYPDVLVYRSYPSIYFTIEFERKQPDLTYLLNVLSTSSYKITSQVEFDFPEKEDDFFEAPSMAFVMAEADSREEEVTNLPVNAKNIVFKFEMTNDKASKFNRHRRWAKRWVHEICEVQLEAIHEKYPMKSVTLNEGINELDFDWWISRQKWRKLN